MTIANSTTDPADFELVQLDDQDEIAYTRLQNSSAWKGVLSTDDYILRDVALGKSKIALSKVNRLLVFALRSRLRPKDLFCSIELLIRELWRFEWDDASNTVSKKNVLSGCIGGVYTAPVHRGKGLARIMVDQLVELGKSTYLGPDGFTFLYSEVGEYYARNGFKSFHVPITQIPLKAGNLPFKPGSDANLVEYHQFQDLFDAYNKHFSSDIESKVAKDHKTRISVNPTADYIDWFHLRAKYIAYILFGGPKDIDFHADSYESIVKKLQKVKPEVFGIRLDSSGVLAGFVAWTYDWAKNDDGSYSINATIIKLFVDDASHDYTTTAIKLIELAKGYLEQNHPNAVKLSIWESEIGLDVQNHLLLKLGAVGGVENSSRSAILYNNASDDEALRNGEIVWEDNSKLPWC